VCVWAVLIFLYNTRPVLMFLCNMCACNVLLEVRGMNSSPRIHWTQRVVCGAVLPVGGLRRQKEYAVGVDGS